MAQHNRDYRLSLAVFLWVQAWIAVPRLASELPLVGPLGAYYVWNKVWAALLLPSFFSLIAMGADLRHRSRAFGHIALTLGVLVDALYFLHQLAPPDRIGVAERWIAAACSLAAITGALQSSRQTSAPGLEILAALTLMFAFAAGPHSALIVSGAVLAATLLLTREHSRHPPST